MYDFSIIFRGAGGAGKRPPGDHETQKNDPPKFGGSFWHPAPCAPAPAAPTTPGRRPRQTCAAATAHGLLSPTPAPCHTSASTPEPAHKSLKPRTTAPAKESDETKEAATPATSIPLMGQPSPIPKSAMIRKPHKFQWPGRRPECYSEWGLDHLHHEQCHLTNLRIFTMWRQLGSPTTQERMSSDEAYEIVVHGQLIAHSSRYANPPVRVADMTCAGPSRRGAIRKSHAMPSGKHSEQRNVTQTYRLQRFVWRSACVACEMR